MKVPGRICWEKMSFFSKHSPSIADMAEYVKYLLDSLFIYKFG